ncbi:hypothetical protein LCGC14_2297430, partial [marine sediment metagenome]
LPVASIEMGAVREVIGNAGAYAPPDDAPALAQALRVALEIPRSEARARVERMFSLSHMVRAYETLYHAARAGLRQHLPCPDPAAIELDIAPAMPAQTGTPLRELEGARS